MCGHDQDVWRQSAANMPDWVLCDEELSTDGGFTQCLGQAFPLNKIHKPMVVYKGDGWTPATHQQAGEVIIDDGGSDADSD